VYETSECIYVYFIIPRLVHKEVTTALVDLKRYVQVAFSPKRIATGILDAPNYFFVSTQLAKKWPQLFECSVVLAFHSLYPGVVASKWRQPDNDANLPNTGLRYIYNIIKRAILFSSIGTVLQYIGALPMRIQKAALHTLQPLTIAVVFLCIYILEARPIFVVIPAAFLLLFVAYRLRRRHLKRKQGEVTPVVNASESEDMEGEGEAETEIGDGAATRRDIIAQLSNMLQLHEEEEEEEEEGGSSSNDEEDEFHSHLDKIDKRRMPRGRSESEEIAEIEDLSSLSEGETAPPKLLPRFAPASEDDSDSSQSVVVRIPERL
jgi:hypothetical protein